MDLGFYKGEKIAKSVSVKEGKDDNGVYYYLDIEGLERRVGLPEIDHYIESREAKVKRLKDEISSAKMLAKDMVAVAMPKKKPKPKRKKKK